MRDPTISNLLKKAERCKLNNANLSYGLGNFSTEKVGLGEVSYRIIMTVFKTPQEGWARRRGVPVRLLNRPSYWNAILSRRFQ